MNREGGNPFRKLFSSILHFQTSHPLLTLVIAFALAGLSMFFTVSRLGFETSQRALISSENRLMQLLQVADRFSELDGFIVAVENKNTERSLQFAGALASALEADRKHFAQVFYRVDPARFRPWALLYLKPEEITELGKNLKQHEAFIRNLASSPGVVPFFQGINEEMASNMVGHLFTGFLESSSAGGDTTPQDLNFLIKVLKEMKANVEGSSRVASPWRSFFSKDGWADEAENGYFFTEGKRYLLLFVAPNTKGKGASSQGEALATLRRTVGTMKERFPGIQAGVTGQKALDEDEKDLATRDIGMATTASLIALALLLIGFWRTIRRPLLQIVTQMVGLSLTFGLTTLFIGHLNLLSITFAPMVLGLGIDYDIHWFARYSEERRRAGRTAKQALSITMGKMGPAIVLAALSTCLAFLPLALTGFRGLAELGIICAIGLFVSSVTTVCLLPSLILLFDKPEKRPPRYEANGAMRPFLRFTRTRALVILTLTAVASGFSIWGAGKIKFDLNMLHLQSKTAESVVWETRLIEGSRYPSIYGVLFARSQAEVVAKTKAAEKLSTVSEVRSVEDFFPPDQAEKIPLVRGMRSVLAEVPPLSRPTGPVDIAALEEIFSRIRFKMDETGAAGWGASKPIEAQMKEVRLLIDGIRTDFRTIDPPLVARRLKSFENHMVDDLNDKLTLLRENSNARPMKISDLPQSVRERFVGPDNLFLIRVFPAADIWNPEHLATFVRDLRTIDPDVTGDPITLHVFTREFRDSSIKAAIYALAFIAVFLAITLRSAFLTISAIAPLVIGALLTFGIMHLFRVDLNLANTIFLPLVIGAGVEYGVIIVRRWQQEDGGGNPIPLPYSTGMGVLLAGLSTTVGFGSLMISGHQGIYSLGFLTTIGSLTVLAVAILFLPALLALFPGKNKDGAQDMESENVSGADGNNQEEP